MDLQTLLQVLESSSSAVRVWVIEFPAGDAESHVPPDQETDVQTGRTGPASELDQARAVASAAPGIRLSPREWAERIPSLVERELLRAIREDVILSEARGEGRGHAAKVIAVDELVRYLATCEGVREGREPEPTWWRAVRKGGRAAIHGEVARAA